MAPLEAQPAGSGPTMRGSSMFTQFWVLCYKNFLLSLRSWKATLSQILAPVAITLLLVGFQALSNQLLSQTVVDPGVHDVIPIPHCHTVTSDPCHTLAYSPDLPWVESILRHVAASSGLDFEETFLAIPGTMNATTACDGAVSCVQAFRADNRTVSDWMLVHPNRTQNIVVFQSAYVPPEFKPFVPDSKSYTVYYNFTLHRYPFFEDDHTVEVKRALDAAIMSKLANRDVDLSVGWKSFPTAPPRLHGYDVVAQSGTWYYVPAMLVFFFVLTEIVAEKQAKLRVGMAFMGMRSAPYWGSWFAHGVVFNFLSALMVMVTGHIADFDLFTNSDFFVLFILFFLFGMSMIGMAFLISSLIASAATAQTVGYTIVLMGFVFQVILGSQYGALIDLLFSDDVAHWVTAVRWALSFYPPFFFSKGYYDVVARACSVISRAEGKVIPGPGYHWGDLYVTRHLRLFNKFNIAVPPTVQTYYWLVATAALYMGLAMYFDAVLPGDNGTPKHPLFFLCPHRWPCRRKRAPAAPTGRRDDGEGVAEEARIAALPNQAGVAARISNLVKVYGRKWWTCRGQDVRAVDGLSLTCREGEILALLGHNGAGKSTTIGVLTGLFKPTAGTLNVFGIDVETEVQQLQRVMGVCPQHDLLFPTLTAVEHLRMYARIKGVGTSAQVEAEVWRVLREVGLEKVANQRVGRFSGGMRRRCSIAIAAVGSPKFLLLDEPTTGLDPVNRREAWRLIQRLKKGRAIILTTHQMEEADALGDRVAVMADGRLKAVGTPLRLKNTYGSGYRLNVVLSSGPLSTAAAVAEEEAAAGVDSAGAGAGAGASGTLGKQAGAGAAVSAGDSKMEEVADGEDQPLSAEQVERRSAMVLRKVQAVVPDATIGAQDAGNLAIVLPFTAVGSLPTLLEGLEDDDTGLISEWGVSYPTMEEVFLRITAGSHFELARSRSASYSRDAGSGAAPKSGGAAGSSDGDGLARKQSNSHSSAREPLGISASGFSPDPTRRASHRGTSRGHAGGVGVGARRSHTLRALCRKNLTLQARQKGQCLCQIITPLTVMGLLILLQYVIKSELGVSTTTVVPSLEVPLNANLLPPGSPLLANLGLAGSHVASHLSDLAGLAEEDWTVPPVPDTPLPQLDQARVGFLGAAVLSAVGLEADGRPTAYRSVAGRRAAWSTDDGEGDAEAFGAPTMTTPATAPATTTGAATPTAAESTPDGHAHHPHERAECLEFFLVSTDPASGTDGDGLAGRVGGLTRDAYDGHRSRGSGLLGLVPQKNCTLQNGTHVMVPFFNQAGSPQDADRQIYDDLLVLNRADLHDLDFAPPCANAPVGCPAYVTPDGSLTFRNVDNTSSLLSLDYVLSVNDVAITNYHRANNFTRLGLPGHVPHWVRDKLLIVAPARLALMDLVNEAYLQQLGVTQEPPKSGLLRALTLNIVATMPLEQTLDFEWIVDLFGSFLYPLALTLQLPLFVFVMVLEKEQKLREMQKSMGMKMMHYNLSHYALNMAIYCTVVAFFWITGVILEFRFFVQTNPLLLGLFFLGWGFSLVSMGFVLCALISSRRVATVVGYIIALFGNLTGIFFSDVVYGGLPPFSLGSSMPAAFRLFPVFSLVRGIFVMNFRCAADLVCYTGTAQLDPRLELGGIIWSLYGMGAAFMVLALYLDAVVPQQYGVPRHPLFCLFPLGRMLGCGKPRNKRALTGSRAASSLTERLLGTETSTGASTATDDRDVAREKVLVDKFQSDAAVQASQFTVLAKHLRKKFGNGAGAKVAVSDMCLAIPRNSCFALLGENGAGKTTTINMLTGVFPPTSGTAWVAGHDIRRDMHKVHLVMGVCQQHDVLWKTLTCEETLLFYARLKGIHPDDEKEHVQITLREVGLWKARHRLVQELSGGMMRRLSIAVAMCGDSQFIVCDEPTTGLDPASRRALWRILARARRGRSMLLTTHDMAEAETLATRIGIMTHGVLRCLGNQQHLKSVHSSGYRLFLNYRPDAEAACTGLVRRLFPSARLDAQFSGYSTFLLPTHSDVEGGDDTEVEPVRIANVFKLMNEHGAASGITDWGVGQVSLEDVFHRIVGRNAHRSAREESV